MRMSQEAFDDIVADEVTSKAVYIKRYQKPEWPGASSGVTVGIGYDLGQTSPSIIRSDWNGRVPDAMLEVMVSCSGATGSAGKAMTAKVRNKITIPWETAIAVHKERVIPRWENKLIAALPNAQLLSPDCFGALESLIFNRGTSFRMSGDRYREMRNIRAHMIAKRFDRIDDEIVAMKRLWDYDELPGLHKRRDREAVLWNKGLPFIKDAPDIMPTVAKEKRAEELAATPAVDNSRTPKGDAIEPDVKEPPAIPHGEESSEIKAVQTDLKEMGYFMVGKLDGIWGGATAGAIAAFKNDRHLPGEPAIDDELKAEIIEAKAEGFTRPISEERATEIPKSRIIEASEKQGAVAAVTTTVGAGGILAKAKEHVETLKEVVDPVAGWLSPFTDLIKDYWWVLLSAGGIYILVQAAKARKARIEDHQKGVTP